ncbi:hypothetical protein MPLB_1500024 [Mesorhizobium sp. ORS 3324]|nr:hypothetical protein MPLB_1500024 [Mesorhizobium sp. ORS 3324]
MSWDDVQIIRQDRIECLLVQESWFHIKMSSTTGSATLLLSRILGAEVRLVDEGFDTGIRRSWEKALY